ncbi:MAG TPA: maleylpyruvate isomerase family mycothiol-dependent enzyme [Motilibacterales bacterium]|nr:maleylpyruvate isomerase family mycothiol-dependent enzyme [Motilibacterales bacterium]
MAEHSADDITTPDPIDVWREAMADVRDAAARASWRSPSVLPGWTVADVMAHVTSIERALLGRQDPVHTPDWETLPHAKEGFGRITEVPVDLRRSRTREDVLAEFDETMADRELTLRALRASDPGLVMSPLGTMMPLDEMLAMRVFDTWVHEQDIRVAVGDPGHLGSAPAHMAAGRMRRSLGFVWAKKVDAPVGATLLVTVTGPGVEFSDTVIRTEDGKGRPTEPAEDPTVALTMSFPGFVALTCGRGPAEVKAVGDQELAERTVARLNIAP